MFTIRLQKEAVADIADAWLWYEALRIGLGDEFVLEMTIAFDKVIQNPYLFSSFSKYYRKHKIRRFPYLILYEIEENIIFIAYVRHTSRKPK